MFRMDFGGFGIVIRLEISYKLYSITRLQHSVRMSNIINRLMRKLSTLLAVSLTLLAVHSAQAQLVAWEPFLYDAGQSLAGLGDNTGGWGGAWLNTSAGNRFATNTAGSLSYSSLPTLGNMVEVGYPTGPTGTTASPQRNIDTTFGALAAGASGQVWVSLLYQNLDDDLGGKAGYHQANLGLFQGTSEKLAVGSPNTYTAGLTDTMSMWNGGNMANISQSTMATPRGVNPANTVFIVVRLDLDNSTSTFDTAYAWFNPDLSSEPSTATAISRIGQIDLSGVNSIRVQAGNLNASGDNTFLLVDEIRIGTSWAAMSAVPEPSTMAVFGLGLLATLLRFRKH